jgi:hypothetical protein
MSFYGWIFVIPHSLYIIVHPLLLSANIKIYAVHKSEYNVGVVVIMRLKMNRKQINMLFSVRMNVCQPAYIYFPGIEKVGADVKV